MQKILFILSVFLSSALAAGISDEDYKTLWNTWKNAHSKFYSPVEDAARFATFRDNYDHINSFNAQSNDVQLGLNQFSDLTPSEFESLYTGCYNESARKVQEETYFDHTTTNGFVYVDYTKLGLVSPVKNQRQCGSCWAFSATAAIESMFLLQRRGASDLSEQQLVDCDSDDAGCDGGYPGNALIYAAENGILGEPLYPYRASKGICLYIVGGQKINTGYLKIVANNRDAVAIGLNKKGPVIVGIQADQPTFQSYKSGVLKSGCGANLNYAALIVGHAKSNNSEYWIVKNSWGTSWGQDGYIYISTDPSQNGGKGVCGILSSPIIVD